MFILFHSFVTENTVVAFYNGVTQDDSDDCDWEACAYKIFINNHDNIDDDDECKVLDIPSNMRTTDSYCATLGHKLNHSFHPNSR